MSRINVDAIAQDAVEKAITLMFETIENEMRASHPPSRECLDLKRAALNSLSQKSQDTTLNRILALNQERNKLAVINNLPEELLVTIFSLVVDWSTFSPEIPHRLANVCRHWYNVVISSQIFWRHITVWGTEIGMLETVLRKNTEGPLFVTLKHPSGEHWMANVAKLRNQSHRWTRLQIESPFGFTTNDFLAAATPGLAELFVHREHSVFPGPWGFRLSEGRHLEYLGLKNVSLNWDSARLSRLRYIHIQDLVLESLSVNQAHSILTASPTLECLVLININHTMTGPSPPSSPIPLLHLEALVLQDIPDGLSLHLLNWIRAPCCTLLSVRTSASASTPTCLFDLGKSFFGPGKTINVRSLVRPDGLLRIASDQSPPSLEDDWCPRGLPFGKGMEFELEFDDPSEIEPLLDALLDLVQSPTPVGQCNITLDLCGDPIMSQTFSNLLLFESGYPWPNCIHRLLPYISSFVCSSKIGVHLLKYLGEIELQSNGSRRFSCPRLTKLTVLAESWGSIPSMDPIVRVLRTLAERRYGWVEELPTGSGRQIVAQPLKVVRLPGPIVYQVRRMRLFEGASIEPMW
ncbi:hypothetical protein FS837_006121 [Tulasnella sp. UAMH 9824]|nr:hypothetical protein FS837_006121 [Tulasnella sp. UAMH 9824]